MKSVRRSGGTPLTARTASGQPELGGALGAVSWAAGRRGSALRHCESTRKCEAIVPGVIRWSFGIAAVLLAVVALVWAVGKEPNASHPAGSQVSSDARADARWTCAQVASPKLNRRASTTSGPGPHASAASVSRAVASFERRHPHVFAGDYIERVPGSDGKVIHVLLTKNVPSHAMQIKRAAGIRSGIRFSKAAVSLRTLEGVARTVTREQLEDRESDLGSQPVAVFVSVPRNAVVVELDEYRPDAARQLRELYGARVCVPPRNAEGLNLY